MAATRIYVTERDGTIVGPLPGARIGTLSSELTGTDSTTLSADPSELADLVLIDREIQVWVGDEPSPRLVGVPFTASRGLDARRVSIPVLGLEAYLARWHIDTDLDYQDVDQLNIGAAILGWAQNRTLSGADANIDVASFALSGVTRTRRYAGDELDNVLDVLEAFQGLSDGFDWAIVPVGGARREWTPYYPRRGIFHGSWVLAYREGTPGNVARLGYDLNGANVTRRHHATSSGGGDGPDKLVGTAAAAAVAGRVLLESVSSESSSIVDASTLVEHATAQVAARSDASRTFNVLVTDPAIAMGIGVGDTLEVDLADDWQTFTGIGRVLAVQLDPVHERAQLALVAD